MGKKKAKRRVGERDWTDEQKEAQSQRMRAMHRQRQLSVTTGPRDKQAGIPELTVGRLLTVLQEMVDSGVERNTRVVFERSCEHLPEIVHEKRFVGENLVDYLIVR